MGLLKSSAFFSLAVQIITGLIDFYVLTIPVARDLVLLKQLLLMEFLVQIVEGIFYVWLAINISSATNITRKRYWDWVITTPVMLITLSSYLIYLKIRKSGSPVMPEFFELAYENYGTFFKIILLNAMMLFFGYLGEINVMKISSSVFAGFLPFLAMFYIIYNNYAKHTSNGILLFSYFFVAWALYGVSALFNYKWKNIFYNILDLIAKNFFGLFLAYVIVSSR
jgi:bacteriorhodopsin